MKERPILFSASMVRAILNGSKTQTRRTIRGKALEFLESGMRPADFGGIVDSKSLCPYGKPGDKLWVRETWNKHGGLLTYHADGDWVAEYKSKHDKTNLTAVYEAKMLKWNPSNNMPRWASRITLEITGVRVERLQDITNNDALDEGTPDLRTIENGWDMRRCFQDLWEQINGVGSWGENPWVWVIEFKKV